MGVYALFDPWFVARVLAATVLPCIVAFVMLCAAVYLARRRVVISVVLAAVAVAILSIEGIAAAFAYDDGRFARDCILKIHGY